FLVVVDPGVGSARRGIAVEAGDYRFVAPDNGVLSTVLDEISPKRIVELTERRYARATVSRNVEGRDPLAPAAARLAEGVELAALGRPVGLIERVDMAKPQTTPNGVTGEVVRVDRFGNLITNVDRKTFDRHAGVGFTIRVGSEDISKVVSTYGDAAPGEICALFGSTDHLAVAAKGGSAATMLAVGRGGVVRLRSCAR